MFALPSSTAERVMPLPSNSINHKSSSSSRPSLTTMSQLASISTKTEIQAGVAMPLPAGVTLDTLGMLCKLSENDLLKLNLPAPLLSAIRVWKAKQGSAAVKAKVMYMNVLIYMCVSVCHWYLCVYVVYVYMCGICVYIYACIYKGSFVLLNPHV